MIYKVIHRQEMFFSANLPTPAIASVLGRALRAWISPTWKFVVFNYKKENSSKLLIYIGRLRQLLWNPPPTMGVNSAKKSFKIGGRLPIYGRKFRQISFKNWRKIPPKNTCIIGGSSADSWQCLRQLEGYKMSQSRQPDSNSSPILTRYGHPIYEVNPSLNQPFPVRIRQSKPSKIGEAYMVAPGGSGEVVGRGAFAFVEEKEVDSEEFVKIYLAGIRQYGELSKAGALLFEFVYKEISGRSSKDKDTVSLNFLLAQRWKPELSRRTYERGMNELLEKGFLYRSLAADMYFVNVRFMFNGDRMALVQSYRRKGSVTSTQTELPLDEPLALDQKP